MLKQNPIKPGSSTLEPKLGAAPMPALSVVPEQNPQKIKIPFQEKTGVSINL